MLALSPLSARVTDEGRIYQNRTIRFRKPDTPVFPRTSNCAPSWSSSNCAGEWRCGSLVMLSKVLIYSHFDRKVRQHILVTPLGNRYSPAMTHYGMEIYNNNIIMPSIYTNLGAFLLFKHVVMPFLLWACISLFFLHLRSSNHMPTHPSCYALLLRRWRILW
jgi:hypothetical protein